MAHIFVSYASEDRPRVAPLVDALEAEGWSVWWDRAIPPGKSFDEVIEEAIDTTDCVIVVWTERGVRSRWVKTEAEDGLRRNVLVPVVLDDARIPLAFRRIQAADLRNWSSDRSSVGYEMLLTALRDLVPLEPESSNVDESVDRQGWSRDRYAEANRLFSVEDWQGALDTLDGIEEQTPSFVDSDGLRDQAIEYVAQQRRQHLVRLARLVRRRLDSLSRGDTDVARTGLLVDASALNAMQRGRNLLPVGVLAVIGSFDVGSRVTLYDPSKRAIATGRVSYASEDMEQIGGHRSREIQRILGTYNGDAAVLQDTLEWTTDPEMNWGIVVDAVALDAVRRGANLLPIGVVGVQGSFESGDRVHLYDTIGHSVGTALSMYSAAETMRIRGRHSSDFEGAAYYRGAASVESRSIKWS